MIRRALSLVLIAWALGFMWFAGALPQPAPAARTDAVVVPTGSGGRIERGLEVLRAGKAQEMLVTGVDREVRPEEFRAQFGVEQDTMDCCITLGFAAVDTRGNAAESAQWMREREFSTLRLVTADWHMRRAAGELAETLPDSITILRDAVSTQPSMRTLFLEYHKFLASSIVRLVS